MELVAVLPRTDDRQELNERRRPEENDDMTTATASKGMERAEPAAGDGQAHRHRIALYNEVLEFIYDEAALLDQQKFDDWAKLLAEDLSYTAPLRITRQGPDRLNTVVRTTLHFDDDYGSIMGRLQRLGTKSAWAEDPPSRTRRLVTNVRVWESRQADEFEVESYLLLSRSRYEQSQLQILSCVRHDLLRRSGTGRFQAGASRNHRRPVRAGYGQSRRLSIIKSAARRSGVGCRSPRWAYWMAKLRW